ncbi:MAG: glycosyltransferase [Pseudodesulfovibrio sp.]
MRRPDAMKILHVITDLDIGGAETTLLRLATGMDPARFESRVVSLVRPGPVGERLARAGIPVLSLGMRRGVPSPAGLWRLVRILRSFRPDVVQTWLYHADLAGLAAVRLAFSLGRRPALAWNIRCSFMALGEYRALTAWTLKLCARLSGQPDAVLTNSFEARRFHTELGYHPGRFEVIPNGFDTDAFRPDPEARRAVRAELGIPADAPVIGMVARFDPMKDHRMFIEAAALAEPSLAAPHFLLAGRGVDDGNCDMARWLSCSGVDAGCVHLLGERSDVARLMAAMDIHVSASLGESFPNAVGESMACGVPNVVTDVGDSRLLVGDTGIVVPPDNPQALAEGMVALLKTGRSVDPGGKRPRSRIENHYSLAASIGNYTELYAELHRSAL